MSTAPHTRSSAPPTDELDRQLVNTLEVIIAHRGFTAAMNAIKRAGRVVANRHPDFAAKDGWVV